MRPNRKIVTVTRGLDPPVGVDFHNGDLYISSLSKIVKIEDVLSRLNDNPALVVVNDSLPRDRHHGWKFTKVGPDGALYVSDDAADAVYRISYRG